MTWTFRGLRPRNAGELAVRLVSEFRSLEGYLNRLWHRPVKSLTAAATVHTDDSLVLCDTSGGGFTVTLPPAGDSDGLELVFRKISSDGNTLTLDGNGSETIDGATTQTTTTQYTGWRVRSDGSNWYTV